MSNIESSLTIINSGSSLSIDGKRSILDRYIVENVNSVGDLKHQEAVATPGVPQLGDVHTNYSNLFCVNVSTKPVNSSTVTIWEVTCMFSTPESGTQNEDTGSTSSFGGAVSSAQTTKYWDVNSSSFKTMEVGTLDRDKAPDPSDIPTTVPKQTAFVNRLVPQFVINASRKETVNPASNIIFYTGKLNSSAVTISGSTYSAATLLCTRITATTEDNGDTYVVNYEFQSRSDWRTEVAAIDPDTGSPYQNLDNITDGFKEFDIYERVNFGPLNL